MKAILIQILIAFLLVNTGVACDCARSTGNSNANYDFADVVFVGRVMSISADSMISRDSLMKIKDVAKRYRASRKGFFIVTLKVLEVTKGRFCDYKAKTIKVRIENFSTAGCGIEYNNYKLFRLYAQVTRNPNILYTHMCLGVDYLYFEIDKTPVMRNGVPYNRYPW